MIAGPDDVTAAVLSEVERAKNPRTKELLAAAVKHLHAFVRETKLTEAEFQHIARIIARLGQLSNESHNEVVLIAGSLGVSSLVCLQNNGAGSESQTTANLMGPFWREGSPREQDGASIVRSPTPGDPIFVAGTVVDLEGRPVEGAVVDVWNTSGEGFYENQDPRQADRDRPAPLARVRRVPRPSRARPARSRSPAARARTLLGSLVRTGARQARRDPRQRPDTAVRSRH